MDFANPHFAEAHWLWLAVALPVIILALHRYASWRRGQQLHRFAAARSIQELIAGCHLGKRRWKTFFLAFSAALFGIAMARPQWGEQVEQLQSWGEDVLFLLDTSRSMLTTDVKPNRLNRAKLAVADFARQQGRGRLGLIVFAGQAFLQCPLTGDQDAFRESLLAVDEKAIPVPGTDIGRALEEGMDSLEKDARRKIMVLVTDGEDLEAGALAMAEKIATNKVAHVVVYTVGVGTETGGTIQAFNAQGVPELVKDEKGEPVVSRLDAKTLQSVARACGGQYFPLGPLGEGMLRIRADIRSSLNSQDTLLRRKLGVDRFHGFVALLLLLLVGESLMGDRRKRPVVGMPVPQKKHALASSGALLAIALFICSWHVAGENIPLPASINITNEGNADKPVAGPSGTNAANEESAASSSLSVLATPRQYYNAGVDKMKHGKLAEAEGLLQTAALSQRREIQTEAIYNLGHVRFKQGLEALKQTAEQGMVRENAQAASTETVGAIITADSVLANPSFSAVMEAYKEGRGAQKQLKAAMEAVKQALDVYSATLIRWERSSSDFKTALELNPKDADAAFNGPVVDRHIAELVDAIAKLRGMMPMLGSQKQELKMRLMALKQMMPPGSSPNGKDEDEDEDGEKPKEPQKGQKEAPNKEGKQRMMNREEAIRWLDALRLDGERKLPMNAPVEGQPGKRDGRDW